MNFLSPEGLIILPFAIIIDAIGIILIIFGLDDFWITDIIAIAIIGGWSYFRSQIKKSNQEMPSLKKIKETRETVKELRAGEKAVKTTSRAKRIKWLKPLAFVGELIPYVGWLPLWTVYVIAELQSSE